MVLYTSRLEILTESLSLAYFCLYESSLFSFSAVSILVGFDLSQSSVQGSQEMGLIIPRNIILSCLLLVGASIWLNASIFLGWGLMPLLLIDRNPRYPASFCMKKDFLRLSLKPLSCCSLWSAVSTLRRRWSSFVPPHLLGNEDILDIH